MRVTLDPSVALETVPRLAESWKRLITAPRENYKVGEVLGHKNLPPLPKSHCAGTDKMEVCLAFPPTSLDPEDSPSLLGTDVFSFQQMTADPWET